MKNDFLVVGDDVIIYLYYKGKTIETVISLESFDIVNSFPNKWSPRYDKTIKGFYVGGKKRDNGVQKYTIMHRLICGFPEGKEIDHINHDTLDNRLSNLRVVTSEENMQNRKKKNPKVNTSYGFHKASGKWRVYQSLGGGFNKHVGLFKTEDEAKSKVAELVGDV